MTRCLKKANKQMINKHMGNILISIQKANAFKYKF